MATIMDGKALSQKLKEQMKERIAQMRAEGIIPKLVVVLVGNDSASEVYVRNKHKSCGEVGIESEIIHLPEETTQEELLDTVYQLNEESNSGRNSGSASASKTDQRKSCAACNPSREGCGRLPSCQRRPFEHWRRRFCAKLLQAALWQSLRNMALRLQAKTVW